MLSHFREGTHAMARLRKQAVGEHVSELARSCSGLWHLFLGCRLLVLQVSSASIDGRANCELTVLTRNNRTKVWEVTFDPYYFVKTVRARY